jgi:hypothetical protein
MRRTLLSLTTMVVALLLACGVALAANITCPGGAWAGTEENDRLTGSQVHDEIQALGGRDLVTARGGTMLSPATGVGTTSRAESAETSWMAAGAPTTSTVARVRPALVR